MSIEGHNNNNIEQEESKRDSFGELVDAARGALIREFPEYADVVDSRAGQRIVDTFVGDVLAVNEIDEASTFHRLSAEKQKGLLGDHSPEDFFQNISGELKTFYEEKLRALKKN